MITTHAFAQESLNPIDQEALTKTQALLMDPEQRQEIINKDDKAKKTDDMVNQLVKTPEQKEALFKIASDIFGDMIRTNKGDPEATTKALKKAAENPEGFFRGLSSEQKKMIKSISSEIEPPQSTIPH